jgi:hypothetical protein
VEPEVLISVLESLGIERCSILSIGGDVSADSYLAIDNMLWTGMGGEK